MEEKIFYKKEIKKYDGYRIRITTVKKQKNNYNETIEIAEKLDDKIKKIKLKDKEIEDLKGRISIIEKDRLDLASKVDTVNLDIKKLKEDNLKQIDKLKFERDKAQKETSELLNNYEKTKLNIKAEADKKIAAAKGGFTKEINKLKIQNKEKDEQIQEQAKKIKELEERNHNQETKIIELKESHKHISEEYQNDGLPKQTKKALKNVIEKKQFVAKKMIPENVTEELNHTVEKLEITMPQVEVKANLKESSNKKNNTVVRKKGFRK